MRYQICLLFVGLVIILVCEREPTIRAGSLIELHESWERMERELHLSPADAATLEAAIDVLVGEAARELIESRESKYESLSEADRRREAEILAPLVGLDFDEVLTAATARTLDEKGAVLAALWAERAAQASSGAKLEGRLRRLDEALRSFHALALVKR